MIVKRFTVKLAAPCFHNTSLPLTSTIVTVKKRSSFKRFTSRVCRQTKTSLVNECRKQTKTSLVNECRRQTKMSLVNECRRQTKTLLVNECRRQKTHH